MAVSSIKGCWYKFSARIRDYLDVVDSYYRPADETGNPANPTNSARIHHHHHTCERSIAKDGCKTNNQTKSSQHNGHRHNHHNYSHHHHHQCIQDPSKQLEPTNRSQLPPGFCKRKTSQGQVYFVDPSGHKYWYDPSVPKELLGASLNLDSLVGRLSSTWEIRQTTSGKTYYVNHIKKTTQFTDPRLVAYRDHLMSFLKHAKCAGPTTPALNPSIPNPSALVQRDSMAAPGQRGQPLLGSSTNSNNTQSRAPNTNDFHNCSYQHHHSQSHRPTNQASNISHPRRSPSSVIANHRHENFSTNPQLFNPQHNQYQLNLLSGSHHNLSATTNHSNTLTGPPPAWFKPPATNGARKPIASSLSPCQANLSRLSTITQRVNRSDSVTNLFPPSANTINSNNRQQTQTTTNKELFDKISILRQELLKQQVIAHPCRIEVNRKRIFEESFRAISQMQPRDLKKRLLVKFKGEEGLDYGGVAREWFYLLSREILNPVHGLFQYTSDDIYNLQINPDSGIVYREHLSYLNFCGRVIGMAVFHGHFIEGHFTLPFYKMLLKKPIGLKDIEFVDPDLHRSLCWILDNDITNVIDTTFLVQHNAFGELQEHELKENGRNVAVTEDNKHEYVSLYVNYRCRRGIENQFEALQRGFYELIPPCLVENFDEYELELLIGGLSKINIEDWRVHTKLKNCTVETPLVRWFWDIVKSYGEDKRARLLQFVTGSPRVPIQGFKALQGVNSELRLFTIHLIKNACTDNLPKSHTCFNRIDLPPYETFEKLRDKLTQAIEETMGFTIQ